MFGLSHQEGSCSPCRRANLERSGDFVYMLLLWDFFHWRKTFQMRQNVKLVDLNRSCEISVDVKCQMSCHGKSTSNVKSKSSNVFCQISRSCEISTMLYYNQIVQIRLAHRLYTDFQCFFFKTILTSSDQGVRGDVSNLESSRVEGNLEGGGDGFPNISRVLVEYGHSLIINLSTFIPRSVNIAVAHLLKI